jgi:hypothetical protein
MSANAPEPQKNAPQGEPRPPKLLDRVRERHRSKHYSICTEQSYFHWIKPVGRNAIAVPPNDAMRRIALAGIRPMRA